MLTAPCVAEYIRGFIFGMKIEVRFALALVDVEDLVALYFEEGQGNNTR